MTRWLLAVAVCCCLNSLAAGQPGPSTDPRAEAIREAEEALLLALQRAEVEDVPPEELADNLRNLAAFYHTRERYEDALSLHDRALSIRRRALGRDHPDVARSLTDIGQIHTELGDLSKAARYYRRALKIRQRQKDDQRGQLATSLNNLAHNLLRRGKHRRAATLFERELALLETQYGPTSPRIASSIANLADAYLAGRKIERAESLYRRAIDIAEADASRGSRRRLIALLERFRSMLDFMPERAREAESIEQRVQMLRQTPDVTASGA